MSVPFEHEHLAVDGEAMQGALGHPCQRFQRSQVTAIRAHSTKVARKRSRSGVLEQGFAPRARRVSVRLRSSKVRDRLVGESVYVVQFILGDEAVAGSEVA